MRYAIKKKILLLCVVVIAIMIFLHPDMSGRGSYEYIEKDSIMDYLYKETAVNFTSSAVIDCDYRDVIYDQTTLSISLVDGDLVEGHRIRNGGEYSPQECKAKFSTAVIVPYRDRAEQLRGFLVYMHTFFRHQNIHYRIFVIEQVDSRPFNRAKLLNIGAKAAMKAGYPCLILHDIDLIPLKPANLYSCTVRPRHMSSSINNFRCLPKKLFSYHHIMPVTYLLNTVHNHAIQLIYSTLYTIMQFNFSLFYNHSSDRYVLPYLNLFGGAIAILTKDYKAINGMSNDYFGQSGEDDDLYSRIEAFNLTLCRFEPDTSKYHMFSRQTELKGYKRNDYLTDVKSRIAADGLSTLKFTEVATVLHPLFTHIMVDL